VTMATLPSSMPICACNPLRRKLPGLTNLA
jgi:hypothetical protein